MKQSWRISARIIQMPKQILWSPSSKKDFISILGYLQNNWDQKVVLGFIEILNGSIVQISNTPKLFPLVNKNVRKCVLTKHII